MSIPAYVFVAVSVCLGVHSTVLTFPDYKDHSCIRHCHSNRPKTCEYNFTLEYYYTLSDECGNCPLNTSDCDLPGCITADGVKRPILVINRMLPGPMIYVCQYDTLVINVHNKLRGGEGAAIHWHGVYQEFTPYMDGVAMVTQCPIPTYTTFQYRFQASNPGTHFWHGHSGPQRADGIFGALVIKESDVTEHDLYDLDLPEHVIIVNDWLHVLAVDKFTRHDHASGSRDVSSLLINGKGIFAHFTDVNGKKFQTPYSIFYVEPGKRYRFRLINNGILNCPVRVSLDNHMFTAIASDGLPFEAVHVKIIRIFAGERYDVIIHANQNPGNYWLRMIGDGDCDGIVRASQKAIIRYEGAGLENPSTQNDNTQGKILNLHDEENGISVTDLKTLVPTDEALFDEADKTLFLHLRMILHLDSMSLQINNISLEFPPSPPLSQLKDIPQGQFCNATTRTNCTDEYCQCTHLLRVDLFDVVEMIILGTHKNQVDHPFHLHGHSYRVIGMGQFDHEPTEKELKEKYLNGELKRNFQNPVAKDTVYIPENGYVILRLYANNPGFWFFHCHIELHTEFGMGLILQVGTPSDYDIHPSFPKCGNWKIHP